MTPEEETIEKTKLYQKVTDYRLKNNKDPDTAWWLSQIDQAYERGIQAGRLAKEAELWEPPCKGCGHHDSMWKTLVTSTEWQLWEKEQSLRLGNKEGFDVDEARELGCMSKGHWDSFVRFIRTLTTTQHE